METVLFVDDEENVLNSLKRGLMDEDYKCFFASSGEKALEVMSNQHICVIVSDMRMPGMDGIALLKEVKAKYPKTVRVVLSGYTQLQQVLVAINQADIFKFITKPWKLEDEFKVVINQALEYYRVMEQSEELKKSLAQKNEAYVNILKNIEDVATSSRSNIQIIKDLGICAFTYITALLEKKNTVNDIKAHIKLIEQQFVSIISVAMLDYKDINFKELLEQYIYGLKNKNERIKIVFNYNAEINNINIKSEVVLILLQTIEEYFINEKLDYYIKFMCEYKSNNSNNVVFELLMLVSQTNISHDKNFKAIDEKVEIINTFFSEAVKHFKLNIFASRTDANTIIKIQIFMDKKNNNSGIYNVSDGKS